MTTIRATMKDGQLVIHDVAGLRLAEGESVELLVLPSKPQLSDEQNPFVRWIGALPPLPDGEDSVSYYRKMRDGEGE